MKGNDYSSGSHRRSPASKSADVMPKQSQYTRDCMKDWRTGNSAGAACVVLVRMACAGRMACCQLHPLHLAHKLRMIWRRRPSKKWDKGKPVSLALIVQTGFH